MSAMLILAALLVLIVVATGRLHQHPFLALLLAALLGGAALGIPLADLPKLVGDGFGTVLGQIGLVIVLGTVIGVILEKTGAAVSMANAVIRLLGQRFPTLTMSLIGYIVSIPVFCDSAFVILNSLRQAMAQRMQVSSIGLGIALATGLYATHSFVPPTPGPIAAAGNLDLANLGLLIGLGMVAAVPVTLIGTLWANRFLHEPEPVLSDIAPAPAATLPQAEHSATPPGAMAAFTPIFLPILLIAAGSMATLPGQPLGAGIAATVLTFAGHPLVALTVGLAAAATLIPRGSRLTGLGAHVAEGLTTSAPILLITGAGGAFGAVLRATEIGTQISELLVSLNLGLVAPFLIAAGFKTAQGSTTVALVATSALMAPMLGVLGLDSDVGRVLMVLAIGAGAMTVSHVNDSFFWVVSQLSRMPVALAYRSFTIATLLQGLTGLATVHAMAWVLL